MVDWPALLKAAPARNGYCGRLAPTPSGLLHIGHAATFLTAAGRSKENHGTLLLRIEDIDSARCRDEFVSAALRDLRWLALDWDEGPDVGGSCAPYKQSQRHNFYRVAWKWLRDHGAIYPSHASRKEVALAASAPHANPHREPLFPATLRPPPGTGRDLLEPGGLNWRFQIPDGEILAFSDAISGEHKFIAGTDFGDFLVWRKEGGPSYELAVVVDDILMGVTEVTRGGDLLLSTARQLLLYKALGATPPSFAHAPLICDKSGNRLAKRRGSEFTIESLRLAGGKPENFFHTKTGLWHPDWEQIAIFSKSSPSKNDANS